MHRLIAAMLVIAFAVSPCAAQDKLDGFLGRIHKNKSGQTMPYRLFIPSNYTSAELFPLVLFLHGAGERGNDNSYQLSNSHFKLR